MPQTDDVKPGEQLRLSTRSTRSMSNSHGAPLSYCPQKTSATPTRSRRARPSGATYRRQRRTGGRLDPQHLVGRRPQRVRGDSAEHGVGQVGAVQAFGGLAPRPPPILADRWIDIALTDPDALRGAAMATLAVADSGLFGCQRPHAPSVERRCRSLPLAVLATTATESGGSVRPRESMNRCSRDPPDGGAKPISWSMWALKVPGDHG